MLSKATKFLAKTASYNRRFGFSSVKASVLEIFNVQDRSDPHYRAATFNPVVPLEGHRPQYAKNSAPKYEITKLKNGITVVTESLVFPNVVDLGILLDVGVRDETNETSGSLLSIKNTYYKTVLNTNETINYGMVQMSGGDYDMEYDQENAYFKAHCLSHDVVDIFNMMADCALEPRSVVAASLGIEKNGYQHHLDETLHTGADFNDKLMSVAYGNKGLGMPLHGTKGNSKYLNANVLQKFQLENINPSRIFLCAAGIENHQEFVDLCESKLSFIPGVSGDAKRRDGSEYIGGEARLPSSSNETTLALAFESVNWTHENVFAFQVLNTLLGSSSSFSTGGPGKGMHARTTKNLLNKLHYVDSANAINFNFSDSGLFGLSVNGPSSNSNDLLNALVGELKGLTDKIDGQEIERAKNITKSNILMALERQKDRLEEAVKNVKTYGKLTFQDYCNNIDKVNSEQVNSVVSRILGTRPTFIAQGGEVNRLPSLDKIENMLKH
jgi:predicted Zn-dependent peptidase